MPARSADPLKLAETDEPACPMTEDLITIFAQFIFLGNAVFWTWPFCSATGDNHAACEACELLETPPEDFWEHRAHGVPAAVIVAFWGTDRPVFFLWHARKSRSTSEINPAMKMQQLKRLARERKWNRISKTAAPAAKEKMIAARQGDAVMTPSPAEASVVFRSGKAFFALYNRPE